MESLYDLIHQKNLLPKGNVYKKEINNHFYYYYQYRENGKNTTKQVSLEEAADLALKISKRKQIETKISEILKEGNKNLSLSNKAREYTGYVMSGDKIVAEFNKGELVYKNDKLCPLVIKRSNSLLNFLKSRVIDSSRTNSRLLKKILNINVNDDTLISLCSYAASVTDNYWFKPKHSKLRYKDITFKNDMLFDTALRGLITVYPKKIIHSPELTTNGSYEKGWKNENGKWWLYKVGSNEEIYSEMFYSRLFEELKLPTAHYEIDGKYIKTMDFSDNFNFEPMIYIVGENDDLVSTFSSLKEINSSIASDYLRLCLFDVVLNNVDRHSENCGVLRDRESGRIVCLAPNFDDNLCLISRETDLAISADEGFLKFFIKLIRSNNEIKESLKKIDFPDLTEEILDKVNRQINIDIKADHKQIKNFVLFRYKTLLEEIIK